MPALTVSTRTPDTRAGEYGDTRLANGGCGAGGTGSWLPDLRGGAADGDSVVPAVAPFPAVLLAGCLPLDGVGAGAGSAGTSFAKLYGGLGALSGFCICICMDINSRSCFSAGAERGGQRVHGGAFSSSVVRAGKQGQRTRLDTGIH